MEPELYELIRKAKRELRQASGVPLTPQENEEERRRKERDELVRFMCKTFGVDGAVSLRMNVISHDGHAVIAMTAEDTQFHLRKAEHNFVLFVLREKEEHPLIEIPLKDPHLANRVIVAVGNEIDPNSEMGKDVSNA
jgi:hypothetical protein